VIRFRSDALGGGGRRVELWAAGEPLATHRVLDLWRSDADFRDRYTAELAAFPAPAFRWETPPVTAVTLGRPAEFVLIGAPEIDLPPDPSPFAEHFDDEAVVSFPNLGGDGLMIAPTPCGSEKAYSHLGAFLRGGPPDQIHALWQAVGAAVADRVGERPLWLSSAGGGVAWLHLRLDSWPKYYAHGPYRAP